jgi:hypothetical protein
MSWHDALALILLLFSALALVPAAVLLLQLLAAAWWGDAWIAAQPQPARAGTLAVLMPAHDEADGIEPAIRAVPRAARPPAIDCWSSPTTAAMPPRRWPAPPAPR